MTILLDENVHVKLRFRLSGHDVMTVRDMGWSGKRNGELMQLMINARFDVMITLDKGFEHQQNFAKYPIPIVVLNARQSDYEFLPPLVDKIKAVLATALPLGVTIISPD